MAGTTKFDSFQDLKLSEATDSDEPSVTKRRHEEIKEFIALLRQNYINQTKAKKSIAKSSLKNGQ